MRMANEGKSMTSRVVKDASIIFDKFVEKSKQYGLKKVGTGIFQADMKVSLINDGPVTILLDSERIF